MLAELFYEIKLVSFQVIMITEAAKVGSEGGHSWMSSVLRGEGEEATV